ncbi:energy-coupling factor transport system permease protein [Thermoactinomyces sp. DSM 45891]|uniref:energy-coupling factor transporter transmembrane component T family protein n=1 Tax=Thermoactinomyces sp. DSM 45891 TaxID=1761907 RepID=UPI0009126AA9|nr:energy-coupling factor transporter transmembrane component T [Thermoactinomyces sp. DSM 45891]SFX37725.1 energy-coupling factor transport system permease protein [Thermoactinomyces sp. DSM 45891]
MNSVIIGQYIPMDSWLHRLDPRSKCIFVFCMLILIFFANNVEGYTLLLFVGLLGVILSRISSLLFLRSMKLIIWMILFTTLFHLFFTQSGSIVLQTPILTIYEEGVRQAAIISVRFILLMIFASLLMFTTSPIDLTDGLESLLSPLRRWKFPVHEFAMMMSIALRFIPTLWAETDKIIKAQKARGADFESGNLYRRVKAYIPVLIPLMISSFRRAEDLATAMEARGYVGGVGRTKLRVLSIRRSDILLLVILSIVATALFWMRK